MGCKSYQANIKRLLTVCPWTSVCCVIAIYRNMLSGTLLKSVCIWFRWLLCFLAQVCSMSSPNSVEVLGITWKPSCVPVLMDGLSLTFCQGGVLKHLHFISLSTLLWPELCSTWGQNDSCRSQNRGCDLAVVDSSVFLKSWCPSALFMIRLMFIFSDLLHC